MVFLQLFSIPILMLFTSRFEIPRTLAALELILKVIHGVSWPLACLPFMPRLRIHELILESLPVWIGGRIFDDNFLVVVGQLVDDIFDRFAEFELIELGGALRRYCNTI